MSGRARTRAVRACAALVLALAGLAAAGCADDERDLEAGKTLFTPSCGGCHTLADAGTVSDTGPNLDDAFRGARQAGMREDQFEGVIKRWIRIAQPPMPRDIVTGEDADNVAAYIASVAGTDERSAVRPAPEPTPEAPDPPRQELN